MVDFARFVGKPTPFMAIAQIVAFPHEFAVFENEAAFQAAQADKNVKFYAALFLGERSFRSGRRRREATLLSSTRRQKISVLPPARS